MARSETDRQLAYELPAVPNVSEPLDRAGYLELVHTPDPSLRMPVMIELAHQKVRLGRFTLAGTYAQSPDVYVAVSEDGGDAISPMNTMFEFIDGKFHVFDTRSTNGTFVNGEQIKKRRALTVGDVIDIGGTPEDGGARVIFHGMVAPTQEIPIVRSPQLTRHIFETPRGGLTLEVDSERGIAVAKLGFDGEWKDAALDAVRRVCNVDSPYLARCEIQGDRIIYYVGEPLEPVNRVLDEPIARAIAADVAEAALACHPTIVGPFDRRQVFVRRNGDAVLFGAGLARIAYLYDEGLRGAMMTTRHFIRCPEEIMGHEPGTQADAFYAALFYATLAHGVEPYPQGEEVEYLEAVMNGELVYTPPSGILEAFAPDPAERPTMEELVEVLRD